MIEFLHVADFRIEVGEPIEVGETPAGVRRMIPILGGEVSGPLINGRVLAGGADFQLLRNDGVAELRACYGIECVSGSRIYIENAGLRHGSPEAMERLRRGEPVDPALIYFRTTPRFETADEAYRWLTRHIFIAAGVRRPGSVELKVYQVM